LKNPASLLRRIFYLPFIQAVLESLFYYSIVACFT